MQPSLNAGVVGGGLTLDILNNLVPVELHEAAWIECQSPRWRFGHGSNSHDPARFWTMELGDNRVFDDIWRQAQARCERLAGARLRVIRQYANAHTYGLGGAAHVDDRRPGTFTLLYYPNPQWKDGWDGETVFYDPSGEIVRAVRPRPNRAVFFDSRMVHVGRAPSRLCPDLRVTVAYKLEAIGGESGPSPRDAAPRSVDVDEVSREGASRHYMVRVPEAVVDQAVEERLGKLSQSIRLPGFAPGEIPLDLIKERYGAQTRHEVLKQVAVRTLETSLPAGSIVSTCDLSAGLEVGDVELRVHATHMPDLPAIDASGIAIQRLCLEQGEPSPEAAAFLRTHLRRQVLEQFESRYRFPLFASVVEREFAMHWKAVQGQAGIVEADVRTATERRLRLGLVISEMARRLGFDAEAGTDLEDKVIDHFVAQVGTRDRRISEAELQEMMRG